MAKLVMAAVLVALLAMTAANAFRTTITDEQTRSRQQHGGQQRQCEQQVQQQSRELRHCAMYLSQDLMSNHFIRMKSSSWRMPQQQQQHLSQCCDVLDNLDRECRCEAVKQALRWVQQEQQEQEQEQGQEQEQEQGQGQEQEQEQWEQLEQQVLEKAKYLPQACNLKPQQCQIRTFYF